jgi:hypothetical protein
MRNWNAQIAHFRNSSGPMKDKRQGRGGARNEYREALEILEEESQIEEEISYLDDTD